MKFADYAAIEAVNISTLLEMKKSPAHYLHRKTAGRTADTPAQALGRAIHCAILEPDEFATRYRVWKRGKRSGKAWTDFQLETPDGVEILTEAEHKKCLEMQIAVHEQCGDWITDGHFEESIVWTHPPTGVICKSRLDFRRLGDYILDLKSALDATPFAFGRAAGRYSYHVRAAFYVDAVTVAFGETLPYYLLAVEKTAPFAAVVYEVPPDLIDDGRKQYEELLGKLVRCLETDEWPMPFAGEVQQLDVPPWDLRADYGEVSINIGGEEVAV